MNNLPNLLIVLKRLFSRNRRSVLKSAVEEFISAVQDEGYHVSDIFQALADIARDESHEGVVETQITWDIVATLLEAAAQEAESRGRELP